ncbi:hypothetical protein AMTR_s00139p00041420 [Amborella trichopoda]|uniref:Uncharacterized protein n=1 Tax=Amborella trichopoda TaxID=13333 RepID=W1NEM1_AMBTC|nr:hypothetical protein AMTR_s00139p00041420 [Amborella trichopoda]
MDCKPLLAAADGQSSEEVDNLTRNTKKFKGTEISSSTSPSFGVGSGKNIAMEVVDEMPKESFDATKAGEGWKGLSFKDSIKNTRYFTVEDREEEFDMANLPQEFMEPSDLDSLQESKWSRIVVSNEEMKKLWIPLKKVLIVKLLGRSAGYRVPS